MRLSVSPRAKSERRVRRFVPQVAACLEARSLLSAFAATALEPMRSEQAVKGEVQAPAVNPVAPQLPNVTFPTVDGQFEQLDVYVPSGQRRRAASR